MVTNTNSKNMTIEQMREAFLSSAKESFECRAIEVKEYRLMYKFGCWVTSSIICAENDSEAIFDADFDYQNAKATDTLQYALWCGNRLVKKYNY